MKAVVFDLFETLVTESDIDKFTLRDSADALDMGYSVFRHYWDALTEERYLGRICGTLQAYHALLKNMGATRDETAVTASAQKRDEYKNKCFNTVDPAILEMLSVLRKHNFKIGIIGNCATEEVSGLADSELDRYVDVVVLSCDTELVIPDPRIYQRCLAMLDEAAADCYYVASDGEKELQGARNADMVPLKALWYIDHYRNEYAYGRTFPAFEKPEELTAYILDHQERA